MHPHTLPDMLRHKTLYCSQVYHISASFPRRGFDRMLPYRRRPRLTPRLLCVHTCTPPMQSDCERAALNTVTPIAPTSHGFSLRQLPQDSHSASIASAIFRRIDLTFTVSVASSERLRFRRFLTMTT